MNCTATESSGVRILTNHQPLMIFLAFTAILLRNPDADFAREQLGQQGVADGSKDAGF